MKRALYLLLVAGCGGKAPPPPAPPPAPVHHVTRVPVEDPEDDDGGNDGVTFVNSRGHMDKTAIEAGLAPHNQELADCYMTRVGRRRWLGGHVKIHWDISKDGTVQAVKLMSESNLGAWPIEKCLLDVARSATFDKPVGGDADFDIPLDFAAKGNVLPWDEDQSLRAVGGQLAKLDACGKKTAMPDDVVVTVYVGPRGKAQSVGFSSDTSVIEDKWATCAEKAALKWRLPDPHGIIARLAIRYRPR